MPEPKGFLLLHDRMGFEFLVRASAVNGVINTGTFVQVVLAGMNEPVKVKEEYGEVVEALQRALLDS
ncbi:MAG: hypothetical protein DRP90_00275 [Planctomycetota bacterium]|nr:MAG: hypothetical protein DRP90_00275 [Planctomycetota bacterium]